jgi:ABC-type Mn2+/Zn2+ transport system permease subunit
MTPVDILILDSTLGVRLPNSLGSRGALAAIFAVAATAGGSTLGVWLHRETGPLIVTISATGFLITVLFTTSNYFRNPMRRLANQRRHLLELF